jgi:autotransporter-associated beta strand protein
MKTTHLIKDSLNHSSWQCGFLLIPLALALAWRSFHGKRTQSFLRPRAWAFLPSAAAILTLLLSIASSSFAGSATWKASPANGEWFTANNWVQGTIPNAPGDTATFASSNRTSIDIPFDVEVNGIVFNPGASAFTIASNPAAVPVITISGVGITNNSGIVQHFVVNAGAAQISFLNSATAGSSTAFTSLGTITFGASSTADNATFTNNAFLNFANTATAGDATFTNNSVLIFDDNSTAGNGTFNNGTLNTSGGFIQFGEDSSDAPTAGNGIFTNLGSPSSTVGGGLVVLHFGTAGDATFINDGATASGGIAGETLFQDTGDAGNATLIANGGSGGGDGGSIQFATASTGGTARVEVFGNGTLDISGHNAPGVTTGSIEGSGLVFLGGVNLTVGANNLSTTFSGLIQDGGFSGGTGGSLTKAGRGKLSLANANTYTGGTTITKGTLLVKNTTGSATGTGAVHVNAGTLGGTGKITGAVTVGTGSSSGATLLPGNSATKPGILTISSALTFNSLSTYKCVLSRPTVKASQAVGLGVTINSGVPFIFLDTGTGTLTAGTVFTVINNTSASPIFGTFSNLANGSVFTSNGNNFQASYTGGTGNDLTLTVVP